MHTDDLCIVKPITFETDFPDCVRVIYNEWVQKCAIDDEYPWSSFHQIITEDGHDVAIYICPFLMFKFLNLYAMDIQITYRYMRGMRAGEGLIFTFAAHTEDDYIKLTMMFNDGI